MEQIIKQKEESLSEESYPEAVDLVVEKLLSIPDVTICSADIQSFVTFMFKVDTKFDSSHAKVVSALASLLTHIIAKNILGIEEILCKLCKFLKNSSFRCESDTFGSYITLCIILRALATETWRDNAQELCSIIKRVLYIDGTNSSSISEVVKDSIIPKMVSLAQQKHYTEALGMWTAVAELIKIEKIPNVVTNVYLSVASMAFKESIPSVHMQAFDAWKMLILNLPQSCLKKAQYHRLLLNPLNRVYRDTDSETAPKKFSAWWQFILSLAEDVEPIFDDIVVPLIQKSFAMPSSKTRMVNPTAFTNPTRAIVIEAYAILALILYKGDPMLSNDLSSICDSLSVPTHYIADACFVKHGGLLDEALTLVFNNIRDQVSPPPANYPYILCKCLFERIATLFENNHLDLVRLFLGFIHRMLSEPKFFAEDPAKIHDIYVDLINGLPQRLLGNPQFNFRSGSSAMHECPITTLTSSYIQVLLPLSASAEHAKKFISLLKLIMERAGAGASYLHFCQSFIEYLLKASPSEFKTQVWCELVDHFVSYVKRTHDLNQGSSLEHDFTAVISVLSYPHSELSSKETASTPSRFCFTSEAVKRWQDLFSVYAIESSLVKDISPNQPIEELYANIHRCLCKRTELAIDSLVGCVLTFEKSADHLILDNIAATRKLPMGRLTSFVQVLTLYLKFAEPYMINKSGMNKQRANVCVVLLGIANKILSNAKDDVVSKALLEVVTPPLIPYFKVSKSKAEFSASALSHVMVPVLHQLFLFMQTFVAKCETIDVNEGSFLPDIIVPLLKECNSHWKSNIRDLSVSLGKTFEAGVPITQDFSSQSISLSQITDIPDVRVPTAMRPQTTPKTTPATPEPASTRRASRKQSLVQVPKPPEDFTPIKSKKKKSLLTDHQLERLQEDKVIPSMYQDLSQGETPLANPPATTDDKAAKEKEAEEDDAIFNAINTQQDDNNMDIKSSEEKVATIRRRSSTRGRRSNTSKEVELSLAEVASVSEPVEEVAPPTEVVIKEESQSPPPNAEDAENVLPAESSEDDAVVPKKKKRFSYNGSDEMKDLQEAESNDHATLTAIAEKMKAEAESEKTKNDTNNNGLPAGVLSPLRPMGSLKRKLGQTFESPINAKLAARGFHISSPTSRSRMLLEASQARTNMAGSTPRHNSTISMIPVTPSISSEETPPSAVFNSPSITRRVSGILKRTSTGVSAKRVSFSASNEVCSFAKNSTAKTLFPPITVEDPHYVPSVVVDDTKVEVLSGVGRIEEIEAVNTISPDEILDEVKPEAVIDLVEGTPKSAVGSIGLVVEEIRNASDSNRNEMVTSTVKQLISVLNADEIRMLVNEAMNSLVVKTK